MPANIFADNIISALNNIDNPSQANKKIADEITKYIKDNTKVSVIFSGILNAPPGNPVSGVVDMFSVTGSCSPANATKFDAWIMQLATNIQTGFKLKSTGDSGLITFISPVNCFLGVPFTQNQLTLGLKDLHKNNENNPAKPVWTAICGSIITWLNTIIPPPGNATLTTPPATGIGTITKVTVL